MAEQTGGGRGDARSNPAAGKTPLARRPRASLVSSHPAATETALGHYGPCARSSLTARFITGHASADRSWANAERHSLEPLVERREVSAFRKRAPRLASVAYLVRLAALRSPHGREGEESGEGTLGARPKPSGEAWLFDN